MRYVLRVMTIFAWALWLGGLIALFLFVTHLFRVDRPTALVAAPKMFLRFERVQLLLAAVTLLAIGGLRLIEPRTVLGVAFSLVAVATIALVISAAVVRPKMERLRLDGESSGPQFRRLHGQSMALYSLQATALAIGGLFIPSAMSATPPPSTKPQSAPPTIPPA